MAENLLEIQFVNEVVVPGDVVGNLNNYQENDDKTRKKIKLGPGLKIDNENIVVYKCGVLRHKDPSVFWVDTDQKRYVPVINEKVIGIITNKGIESYKVDIGSSIPASLPVLAFEGATKKNKPIFKIGDLVYGRLSVANKDMEAELVCTDANGKANGMGPLKEGFIFTNSLGLTRKLLSQKGCLQSILGKYFAFECTVGMNGRTWIKSHSISHTLLLANAIETSEYMTSTQIEQTTRRLLMGTSD